MFDVSPLGWGWRVSNGDQDVIQEPRPGDVVVCQQFGWSPVKLGAFDIFDTNCNLQLYRWYADDQGRYKTICLAKCYNAAQKYTATVFVVIFASQLKFVQQGVLPPQIVVVSPHNLYKQWKEDKLQINKKHGVQFIEEYMTNWYRILTLKDKGKEKENKRSKSKLKEKGKGKGKEKTKGKVKSGKKNKGTTKR